MQTPDEPFGFGGNHIVFSYLHCGHWPHWVWVVWTSNLHFLRLLFMKNSILLDKIHMNVATMQPLENESFIVV